MTRKILLVVAVLILLTAVNLFSQLSLEVVWEKSSSEIIDAKFSPDGKFIYCAIGADIKKLDVQTGEFIATFDRGTFTNKYTYLEISPDGKNILTGGYDGYVNLWNTEQLKLVRSLVLPEQTENQSVYYSSFSPDNKTIIINLSTKHLYPKLPTNEMVLYDIFEDKIIKKVSFERISQVKFSKDGKYFISGTKYEDNPKITLWDANELKPIKEFKDLGANEDGFRKIQLSDDCKLIGVCTGNYQVKIIEIESGFIIRTNDIGTSGFNFELLLNGYYLIYQDGPVNNGINAYKYPNIYQSNLNIMTGLVVTSKEIYTEYENTFSIFNGDITSMRILKKSTTSININPINIFSIKINQDKIIISCIDIENIKILDFKGNILFDKSVSESEFSIKNIYPSGTYICVVKSGGKEYSQKFIVVR
jgi:WD40 repeat protein